jgi:diguanylate cyclase (GGDEF)-like protein
MPPQDRDRERFYEDLVNRGIPKAEIERVYQSLREKGYGVAEARRRSQIALERLRAERDLAGRRRKRRRATAEAAVPERRERDEPAGPVPSPAAGAPEPAPGTADGVLRRAGDWLPAVPPYLRRRINHWAWRHGYLITRLSERLDDLLSLVDPRRRDFASRPLLKLLAERRPLRGMNPFAFSFVDTLDALQDTAGLLLGSRSPQRLADREKARELALAVRRSLESRDPFAVEFLAEFVEPREMLHRSLEFIGLAIASGRRVETAELARVVKDGCRLVLRTGSVESEKLDALLALAKEVNLVHDPSPRAGAEMDEAVAVLRACLANLPKFAHELYPALLKMVAAFFEEEDADPEKRRLVLSFLELTDNDLLTWEGWRRRAAERKERAIAEERGRELERLEQEKAGGFSERFEGTLATLAALFPDSGLDRVEQGAFVLPYFANRVFTRAPLVRARQADLECLAASDAMGLVVVLHEILDDLLASLDAWPLEALLGNDRLGEEFARLREEWHGVNAQIFEPYLDEIREYWREVSVPDARRSRIFRDSQRARTLEERVNRLKNGVIRGFGHVVSGWDAGEAGRLYDLAARLAGRLGEVCETLNRERLAADDPVSERLAEDFARAGIVDFVGRSQTGSTDYKPVVRQLRRWVEARHRAPVASIPVQAQLAFLEVFRGTAELYAYLLNDRASFVARSGHALLVAGEAERQLWRSEREERGRDALALLEARLKEEVAGHYVDGLTGLRNKDFFLKELPARLERLRARRRPLTFLMIDIDHFKWVNDELGHETGDVVLKATAQLVLDSVREGDLPVRYGGEEILVAVPAPLHTGVLLAERLRHLQEQQLASREPLTKVLAIGADRGQPCGTLSVGVAEVTSVTDLGKAVERADRALYAAKQARNLVVFLDASRGDAFTTYDEYRRRLQAP